MNNFSNIRKHDDRKISEELLDIRKKINKVEPISIQTTIKGGNVSVEDGTIIDDSEPIDGGSFDETYSCNKINDELANIPVIKEYYEGFGLTCLELPDGENGRVEDRYITCVWDDLRVQDVEYFADLDLCKNCLTGVRDFALTKNIARKIFDYGIFFYITYSQTPPPNMYPVNPIGTPENEGWFFWGHASGTQATIKLPYNAQAWIMVTFRQKNTDYFSGLIKRSFKYLN